MRTDMMSILAVEARMGPPEAAAAAPLRGPTAWLLADFPGLIAGLPDRAVGRRLDAARLLAIPFVHGFALERAAAVAVRGEMAAAAAGAGWEPVEIPREESAGAWIAREVRRGLEEGRRPDRVILAGGDAALAEAAEAALEREIPVWILAFPGMLHQRLLQAVLSRPRRARVVWASRRPSGRRSWRIGPRGGGSGGAASGLPRRRRFWRGRRRSCGRGGFSRCRRI
jgi:hypothetical protein